jgi:hypothetical protein
LRGWCLPFFAKVFFLKEAEATGRVKPPKRQPLCHLVTNRLRHLWPLYKRTRRRINHLVMKAPLSVICKKRGLTFKRDRCKKNL